MAPITVGVRWPDSQEPLRYPSSLDSSAGNALEAGDHGVGLNLVKLKRLKVDQSTRRHVAAPPFLLVVPTASIPVFTRQ